MRLKGGLGNQFFQYAAARRLSIHHGTELKLDISYWKTNTSWAPYESFQRYGLSHFSVQESFATEEDICKITMSRRKGLLGAVHSLGEFIKPYYRRPVFAEPELRPFDPNILKTPKDVYLDGYWQSERYFAPIADTIRREFRVNSEPDKENRILAEQIESRESVAVHVRRGDRVKDPRIARLHGTQSIEYYHSAARLIANEVRKPHFFVFSDDPQWAKSNLRLDPVIYVTHNGDSRNYEDLRLMSLCKHSIIANSTFSWWAAWLNKNPNKLVIAPKNWFRTENLDTQDLIPQDWTQI